MPQALLATIPTPTRLRCVRPRWVSGHRQGKFDAADRPGSSVDAAGYDSLPRLARTVMIRDGQR
jgi:hypothetical protein